MAAKECAARADIVRHDGAIIRAAAAEERRIDRYFRKWLRNLHRRDHSFGVRVRTPKAQRIPMAPKQDKRDLRNVRSLPAYRTAIIDKLGRRGIVLTFEYDGAARNSFGVFRRRVEYSFQSDGVQRDKSGTPFFVSNMGKTPLEICEASDALEGVMRAERANAKLSVNVVLQFPHDATLQQQLEITRRFCNEVFGSHDLAFVAVLHKPDPTGDQRNFHAHITFAFRQMVRTGDHQWAIGANLRTDLDSADQLFAYRKIAAEVMTKVMRKAGHNRTYTHLSNAERGLTIVPQKNLTKAQSNQVRRGNYVGANEFNAREIAKGEQAIERSVSKVVSAIKAVRAPDQVVLISLFRRAARPTTMPVAKPEKLPISSPSTSRVLPEEPAALGQVRDARVVEPRALPAIISPLMQSTLSMRRPALDLPPRRHILRPLGAVKERTFAPFVSLPLTSTTTMPVLTVQLLAQRASVAAAPPRRDDLPAELALCRSSLPPAPMAVEQPVNHRQKGLFELPARRPRTGPTIEIARPTVARLPLRASGPIYSQQSPVRPNLIPLKAIQPVRLVAQRKDEGLLRVVTGLSTQIVASSHRNRIWSRFVQPVSARRSTASSLRSSPTLAALLTPATAPVLAALTASSLPARHVAMRRMVGQSRPLLVARNDRMLPSLIDLGTRNHVDGIETRCRHRFQLPRMSVPVPSAVTSLEFRSLEARIGKIEVEPIGLGRPVRSPNFSAALPLFSAIRRSTPLLPPMSRPAQVLHRLEIAPDYLAPRHEAVQSPEGLSTLIIPPRSRATSHFASEFDQIRSARDRLADRITATTPKGDTVRATARSLSLVKENGDSVANAGKGPIVDGEELIRRIRAERIYLIEKRGIVLPHHQAAVSGAEIEWLRVHQMDALGVQRDQQLEITRIVAHVDQHIDAFRNQTLRVDEDFVAAWDAFAAAPAVQKVVNKAAAAGNVQVPSEHATDISSPVAGGEPADGNQRRQQNERAPASTSNARSAPNIIAHAQAAAVSDPGRG